MDWNPHDASANQQTERRVTYTDLTVKDGSVLALATIS